MCGVCGCCRRRCYSLGALTIVVNRWCFRRCLYPHLPVPAYLVDIFSMFSSVAFHSLTPMCFCPCFFLLLKRCWRWWYCGGGGGGTLFCPTYWSIKLGSSERGLSCWLHFSPSPSSSSFHALSFFLFCAPSFIVCAWDLSCQLFIPSQWQCLRMMIFGGRRRRRRRRRRRLRGFHLKPLRSFAVSSVAAAIMASVICRRAASSIAVVVFALLCSEGHYHHYQPKRTMITTWPLLFCFGWKKEKSAKNDCFFFALFYRSSFAALFA